MSSFTTVQGQVEALYVGYFQRPGDPGGAQYWQNQLLGKTLTFAQIAASFSVQNEALAKYTWLATGSISDIPGIQAFINSVYMDLFNRPADSAGLAYWTSQLQSRAGNAQGIGQFILDVISGATTGSADDMTLQNKVVVSAFITDSASTSGVNWTAVQSEAASLIAATTNASSGAGSVAAEEAAWSAYILPSNTIVLTPGLDNIIVGQNNATIVGTANGVGATFSPGDSINGNGFTGASLTISDLGSVNPWTPTTVAGVSVSGVQTATFNGAAGVTANTASSAQGWSGLTSLIINDAGATSVTAAATTNVTVVDAGIAGAVTTIGGNNINISNFGANVTIGGATGNPVGSVTVTDAAIAGNTVAADGGTNVNVTITGAVAATAATAQITIGANVVPTGTVTVAATTGTANGNGIGLITVNGGTTVTVTETAGNAGATGNNTFEGNVVVNGTAVTTNVTVNQSPTATGASAVAAVAGVVGVASVAAAPGVQGVTAVTAVAAVAANAAVVGTTAGTVAIQDANYNTTTANTITSVALNNYGNSTIKDNALSNLTLQGVVGTLAITNATSGGGTPTANSTLNLTLNTLSGANTITDTNHEIKTLNVTTAGGNSTLAAFTDSSLNTLNVAGTNVLTLPAINGSLTTLAISGGAGFSDGATTAAGGLAALGAALTITDASSGKFSAALDDTTQTFAGSTGQDVITISSTHDATKVITAGSATNNELILEGGAYALTSATAAKVTGFQYLGVAANVTGIIDMSILDPAASKLDILGNSTIAFNKVATGAWLLLENTNTTSIAVTYADANGASDSTTVTIGSATNSAARTETSILLQDANLVGIGTVNVVSNDTTFNDANVITTLVDNGLAILNVSGNAGLTIGTLSEVTTQATSFTLNNTETGGAGVTITTFTDANLGNVTFSGSNASTIGTVNDLGAVLSIFNTGTSTASIGTIADNALTTLNLGANVALGQAGTVGAEDVIGLQDASNTGVTVMGGSDNAHVTIVLTSGAAVSKIDSITLGNGNNYVHDVSSAGTVNVVVGTGSNWIDLGIGNDTTGLYSVTLGSHTAASGNDLIEIGSAGTAFATTPNLVVTGAVTGDQVALLNDLGHLTTVLAAVATQSTLAAAITAIETAASAAAHDVAYTTFVGNTYVAENNAGAAASATNTTVVELIGIHTFTAGTGLITIAS